MRNVFMIVEVVSIICVSANTSHSSNYWAKTFGKTSIEGIRSIQQTTDGGFIGAGNCKSLERSDDLCVLKYTSDGFLSWKKNYGGDTGMKKLPSSRQLMEGILWRDILDPLELELRICGF